MKLTTKVSLFFYTFIVVWFLIITFVFSNSIMESYDMLEAERFDWEIQRVKSGFLKYTQQYDKIIADWTKWDTAYEHVQNPSPYFSNSNIRPSLFQDIDLDMIFIVDAQKQLITGKTYNKITQTIENTSSIYGDVFSKYPDTNGLVLIDGRPHMFASRSVTNSEGTGTPLGQIVFVSILESDDILKISDELQEKISIRNLSDNNQISPEIAIEVTEKNAIAIYTIPYINTKSFLQLEILLSKEVSELGKKTVTKSLLLFLSSFAFLSLLMYIGVKRYVKKITALTDDVRAINHSKDLTLRIKNYNKGELGILSQSINTMLLQIERMHSKLTNFASFDALTGILNRRGGFEKLELYMKESANNQSPLTICFIDVNDLKYVNDHYGHNIGDEYLTAISSIFEGNIRGSDVLCRLGGDEFLLVYPNCTNLQAQETFERIFKCIELENARDAYPYLLSVSVGIETYNFLDDINHFVEKADTKMYINKKIYKATKQD